MGIVDVKVNKELLFVPDASSPSVLPAKTPGPPTLPKEPNHKLSFEDVPVEVVVRNNDASTSVIVGACHPKPLPAPVAKVIGIIELPSSFTGSSAY